MPREDAQHKNPLWLKLLAGSLAALVVVAAIVVMAPQFLRNPAADVVVIKADPGPFKEKPKDAGGMDIPHQDTTVMGMLNNVLPQKDAPERLRPPDAVPEMPPTPVADDTPAETAGEPTPVQTGDEADKAADIDGDAEADTKDRNTNTAGPDPTENQSEEQAGDIKDAPESDADSTASRDVENASNDAEPAASDAAMPTPKPNAATAPRVVPSDDEPFYIVQLAAFRDAGKAVEQAGLMSQKHASRLNGATLGTMKIDTGENGVFWRVVSEPLPRADADNLCANLKRAGQDCILRKFNVLSE